MDLEMIDRCSSPHMQVYMHFACMWRAKYRDHKNDADITRRYNRRYVASSPFLTTLSLVITQNFCKTTTHSHINIYLTFSRS